MRIEVMVVVIMGLSLLGMLSLAGAVIWHVVGERKATAALAHDAFQHLIAKSPRSVAEAKAFEQYEAESVRQAKEAFEYNRKHAPEQEASEPARAIDARGNVYEILE